MNIPDRQVLENAGWKNIRSKWFHLRDPRDSGRNLDVAISMTKLMPKKYCQEVDE